MDRINLYPEMNKEIVNILCLPGDPEESENQVHLYAAQLIEEQAAELASFKAAGLSPEEIRKMLEVVESIVRDSEPFEGDKVIIHVGYLKRLLTEVHTRKAADDGNV